MKKSMLIAALVAVLGVGSAYAEGVPSQSKLNSLGLSSLNVASDVAGEEIRGEGFGATTLTIALSVGVGIGTGTGASAVGGTQSSVFGQDPQSLNAVSFGGSGFGGFTASTAPNFATFVSTPLTINAATGGQTSVASVQGFSWGLGGR